MTEIQIKQGWQKVKLGDLYKFQYGKGNTNPKRTKISTKNTKSSLQIIC